MQNEGVPARQVGPAQKEDCLPIEQSSGQAEAGHPKLLHFRRMNRNVVEN